MKQSLHTRRLFVPYSRFDECLGLLTGQSVLVFPRRLKRRSNAIASQFARCDPARPDVNCGNSLGRIPKSPTMDPEHPLPIVDSVAVSVWWHSRETQRDHTRAVKDEHTWHSGPRAYRFSQAADLGFEILSSLMPSLLLRDIRQRCLRQQKNAGH